MGLFDSLFGKKSELAETERELTEARRKLKAVTDELTATMLNKDALLKKITDEALERSRNLEKSELARLRAEHERLDHEVAFRRDQIVELDEEILLQSFSLYKPTYDFATVDEYKTALADVRARQKEMLKNSTAATGATNWTVNGSASKGRKMVADTQKLLLRAFNSECEYVTWRVKYNNFDSCLKRIENACATIQKLGVTMDIEISSEYFDLKVAELRLALEYQQAKQRERERQSELRARQREEAALQKELEEARRKVEKEHSHYLNALTAAQKQFETASETERLVLTEKISTLEKQLAETDKNLSDLDYREANQRAGYVYVISNIGSFGEGIFKIGMTRRLNPQERIDELGGASVPFNFDVHALIFTEDAPKLEAALHRAFEERKVNMVNPRREFFFATIDEIEKVVRDNFDASIEFVRTSDAEQFRESQKIRERAAKGKFFLADDFSDND